MRFIALSIFTILFSLKSLMAAKDAPADITEKEFQRVGSSQYVAPYADDLLFVLERVTSENREFWNDFATDQEKALRTGLIQPDGVTTFRLALKQVSSDIWIAYAYQGTIDEIKKGHIYKENIEMSMTVLTTDESPIVSHMGISRNPLNICRYKKTNEGAPHKAISVPFQSFAAQVMREMDPNKAFMVNKPTPIMRSILAAKLPRESYYIGCNRFFAKANELQNKTEEDVRKELEASNREYGEDEPVSPSEVAEDLMRTHDLARRNLTLMEGNVGEDRLYYSLATRGLFDKGPEPVIFELKDKMGVTRLQLRESQRYTDYSFLYFESMQIS